MLAAQIERCLRDQDGEWTLGAEQSLVRASSAKEVPASAALMALAGLLVEQQRQEDEESPKRDDKDLKKDIVYRLGMRKGISMVLGIPDAARKIIKETQRGG